MKVKIAMEKMIVPQGVTEQLLQNTEDYALAVMATDSPEQIENARRQNDLFDKGLEICLDCRRGSRRDLETCEFCGQNKLPF